MSDTTVTREALEAAQKILHYVVDNYDTIQEEADGASLNPRSQYQEVAFDLTSKVLDYVLVGQKKANEQVEEVARAIYEDRFGDGGWDTAHASAKSEFRSHARAALAVVK